MRRLPIPSSSSLCAALVLNWPMPEGAENLAPVEQRGWCIFEQQLSSLVKFYGCYLELGKLGDEQDAADHERTTRRWREIRRICRAMRPPPLAPDRFEALMTAGLASGEIRFTSGKDLFDVCIPQYEAAFVRLFGEEKKLVFTYLGWGDEQIRQLCEALEYASRRSALGRITSINLSGNSIGDDGAAHLASLLERRVVPRLRVLRVHHNPISDEGRAKLSAAAATCSVSLQKHIPERRLPSANRVDLAPGDLQAPPAPAPPLVQMQSSSWSAMGSSGRDGELTQHL